MPMQGCELAPSPIRGLIELLLTNLTHPILIKVLWRAKMSSLAPLKAWTARMQPRMIGFGHRHKVGRIAASLMVATMMEIEVRRQRGLKKVPYRPMHGACGVPTIPFAVKRPCP